MNKPRAEASKRFDDNLRISETFLDKISPRWATNMSVASTDTERIDTDPFCPIGGPLGWLCWNKQPPFLERNYTTINTTRKSVITSLYILLGLG